jgi:hypothetical protein
MVEMEPDVEDLVIRSPIENPDDHQLILISNFIIIHIEIVRQFDGLILLIVDDNSKMLVILHFWR